MRNLIKEIINALWIPYLTRWHYAALLYFAFSLVLLSGYIEALCFMTLIALLNVCIAVAIITTLDWDKTDIKDTSIL